MYIISEMNFVIRTECLYKAPLILCETKMPCCSVLYDRVHKISACVSLLLRVCVAAEAHPAMF